MHENEKESKKKAYKDWKKGEIDSLKFVETRKELRGMCREKEKKKQKEVEEEIKNIKTEGEAGKFINRMREKKEGISEKIDRREWRDYFKEMFNGSVEKKMDNEKIKERKRRGQRYGLSNEVWFYSCGETRRKFREVVKRVWKGEGFPEEWKEGLITPIFKKREKGRIENYRGITLLNSAYKVYAMVLTERLRKEIENKE